MAVCRLALLLSASLERAASILRLLILALLISLPCANGNDPSKPPIEAGEAAIAFVNAIASDPVAAKKLATADSAAEIDDYLSKSKSNLPALRLRKLETTATGVLAEVLSADDKTWASLWMVKRSDGWKVDFYRSVKESQATEQIWTPEIEKQLRELRARR